MATKTEPPLTPAERADARAARRADNRARWRGKHGDPEAPEFAAQQTLSLDAVLQSLGGSDQGISVVVLQVAPQRHGELGGPSHILEQPYAPTLREADLKELARQSGSADPGTFELRIVKSTEKGPKILQVFRRQWRWKPDPASVSPDGAVAQMRSVTGVMKDTVGMVRELGGGGSGLGPIDLPALINAVNRPAAANPLADRLIETVIARLVTPEKPADPLATLASAAEFLDRVKGTPPAPTSPLDAIKGLGDMLATVKALAGHLGPEAPAASPWIDVLRIVGSALAPLAANIPAMWQMAQTQRQQELEFRKRETLALYVRAGVPLPVAAQLVGVTLPPAALGSPPPGRQEDSAAAPAEAPPAGPLAPYAHAIIEGDASAFPNLAATILALPNGVGQKILDGLAADPNALRLIRAQIEANGGRAYFAELFLPGSEAFFAAFADWLRSQGGELA